MSDYNINHNTPQQQTTNSPAVAPQRKPALTLAPLARLFICGVAPSSGLCDAASAYCCGTQHITMHQEHVPILAWADSSGIIPGAASALVPQAPAAKTRVKPKSYDVINIRPPVAVFDASVQSEDSSSFCGFPTTRLPDTTVIHLGKPIRQRNFRVEINRFTLPKAERQCPYCGAMGSLNSAGVESLTLRHCPYEDHPTKIEFSLPAWRCEHCGQKHTERCPGRFGSTHVTERKYACIVDRLHSGCKSSIRDIAISFHESEKFVAWVLDYDAEHSDGQFAFAYKLLKGCIEKGDKPKCNFRPPLKQIRKVAIDEVAVVGREYLTLFSDLETGELLFFAWGHGKDTVAQFIAWAGDMVVEDVQVATDMNAGFLSAMQELRPKCVQSYDRFHFESNAIKHLSSMLNEIAGELQRKGLKAEAKQLRDESNQCLLFTANKENWGSDEHETLDKLLNLHPMVKEVNDCFLHQHNGFECHETRDREQAETFFNAALQCCNTLQLWAVETNGRKFKLVPALAEHFDPPKPRGQKKTHDYATAPSQQILTDAEKRQLKNSGAGKLGRHILDHKDKLLNYVEHGLTTGPLEGFNNLFKAMKRVCYGIKLTHRFLYRLKLISLAEYHRWV